MSDDADRTRLDSFIRARLAKDQKQRLQEIAESRQLKAADILREAVREYLHRVDEPHALEAA